MLIADCRMLIADCRLSIVDPYVNSRESYLQSPVTSHQLAMNFFNPSRRFFDFLIGSECGIALAFFQKFRSDCFKKLTALVVILLNEAKTGATRS